VSEVPAASATSGQAEPSEGRPLRAIKGIGPASAERLEAMGVATADQVAGWTEADLERIAVGIHVSADRIRREDWVGQAQALLKG
jgi:predicted flap endonuclease-1-like 5' DNA nuclease